MKLEVVCGLAVIAGLIGCDNTQPSGSDGIQVFLDAAPDSVVVRGVSGIAISGFRADGTPAVWEPVTVSTTRGRLLRSRFVLDATGRASTVLEAGPEPGTATVTAAVGSRGVSSLGSVDVEVVAPRRPAMALDVSPGSLDHRHGRSDDPCPSAFPVSLRIDTLGGRPMDYRVEADLPSWLTVEVASGPVPGEIVAWYNCVGGEGDVDLAHTLLIQGVDRQSGARRGEPARVAVTIRVRD